MGGAQAEDRDAVAGVATVPAAELVGLAEAVGRMLAAPAPLEVLGAGAGLARVSVVPVDLEVAAQRDLVLAALVAPQSFAFTTEENQ